MVLGDKTDVMFSVKNSNIWTLDFPFHVILNDLETVKVHYILISIRVKT